MLSLDAVLLDCPDKGGAGELAALVGVQDCRGHQWARIAASQASRQKSTVMLLERRQAKTRRVAQSSTATR